MEVVRLGQLRLALRTRVPYGAAALVVWVPVKVLGLFFLFVASRRPCIAPG